MTVSGSVYDAVMLKHGRCEADELAAQYAFSPVEDVARSRVAAEIARTGETCGPRVHDLLVAKEIRHEGKSRDEAIREATARRGGRPRNTVDHNALLVAALRLAIEAGEADASSAAEQMLGRPVTARRIANARANLLIDREIIGRIVPDPDDYLRRKVHFFVDALRAELATRARAANANAHPSKRAYYQSNSLTVPSTAHSNDNVNEMAETPRQGCSASKDNCGDREYSKTAV